MMMHGVDNLEMTLGFISFDRPVWWLAYIPVALVIIWLARKSLSGLGSRSKVWAIGLRLVVAALIIGALAEPNFRRRARDLAVTFILDASRSNPKESIKRVEEKFETWRRENENKQENLLGIVTAARQASVNLIPQPLSTFDIKDVGPTDATNLADAVRRAMSIMPPGAANRLVLVSDGNETIGDLMDAARAAEAAKVPIDVLPVRYAIEREVIVDRLVAPPTARPGELANLRVVLNATKPVDGRLNLLLNGRAVDLDAGSDATSARVSLQAGTNVQVVPVRLPETGPVQFEAVFEAVAGGAGGSAGGAGGAGGSAGGATGDTLTENNRALAVTFIGGQGRILILKNQQPNADDQIAELQRAISGSARQVTVRNGEQGWEGLSELGSFEAVVMVNSAAFEFSQQQQEELKSYVHDLGGGLLMIGGDQAFGAGGWIGSPLADALPIKLDPPQKRQMPRGALGLVMHSCEMPNGNFWGKRCAEEAIKALQAQDYAAVIEFDWSGGDGWVFPIAVVGNKTAPLRALNALTFGDAPSFQTMMEEMLKALNGVKAGQKHVIVISDGDPQKPSDALLQQYVNSKVSVSTVAVFPHDWGKASEDLASMRRIARLTGGAYHEITNSTGNLNDLPRIFVKEAQTIKRTLIWEGDPLRPAISGMSEGLRGISQVPALTGYIVAADREGLSQVVLRGQENDPVLAQWQHGLGRVVTFTGDATTKWSSAWVSWGQFRQFWDQHLRWVMRPSSDPNLRLTTIDEGESTRVIVEAVDEKGERINFLDFRGRSVAPDKVARGFNLVQTGPGRYEGKVDSSAPGVHVVNLGYEGSVDAEGKPQQRGSLQAAVTRPFADEFRALRDNATLLEQVAKRTGGRVFATAPTSQELWDRTKLDVPVSLRPIWLLVTAIMMGMLLIDVAVRRVRIDVPGLMKKGMGLLKPAKEKGAEQLDALRQAREKARARMEQQAEATGGRVGQSIGIDGSTSGDDAARKFEATIEELAYLRKTGRSEVGTIDVRERDEQGVSEAKDAGGSSGAPAEGGLGRLMKAKKRAQEGMEEGRSDER